VNIHRRRLINGNKSLNLSAEIISISALQVPRLKPNAATTYSDINEFPVLTRSSIAPKSTPYGISHAIVTQGQASNCQSSPEKLQAAKFEFEFMLQQRICQELVSQSVTPSSKEKWRLEAMRR